MEERNRFPRGKEPRPRDRRGVDPEVARALREWARVYNVPSFAEGDPVSFPRRFSRKQDIEISGFLTAWISFGRRELILRKAEELHRMMGESPYRFILGGEANLKRPAGMPRGGRDTFYRFYTYEDLFRLCRRLGELYRKYESLEEAVAAAPGEDPLQRLRGLFAGQKGIPAPGAASACKRLAMFLRWMVRADGIVDLGIWRATISPGQLLIPLDTHVRRVASRLGLTSRKSASLATAREITDALAALFPGDPCLGDFALFGYGINHADENQ